MVSFRPWDVDQVWLPPASIHDFVAPEHPAHLVRDLVQRIGFGGHRLGLRPTALPPGHDGGTLLYDYSRGVYSSRQIARRCEERLDYQAVTALNRPDFRTIRDVRKRRCPRGARSAARRSEGHCRPQAGGDLRRRRLLLGG